MIIQNGFYLSGFTRLDMGEEGAVFLHYADDPAEHIVKPEIKETPLYYGGEGSFNYTLSIPRRPPRKITSCAIVTRTSKNCYQAMAYDEKRIESFRADSLDGLRRDVATFFGV